MKQPHNVPRHLGSIIILAVAALLAYWLISHRQLVLDQVFLWGYQPTSDISAIAERTTMTDQARTTFYASRPELDDASAFNSACGKSEQGAAVLGCYTGLKIYIYNVTDAQLDGIHEVTAAHELLHAAYARMSDAEKQTVDALLEQEYVTLSKDPAFADRMALYARTEPGERDNELHSIVGTEVASISPQLEAHYARYFKDRHAVVKLHDDYASVFTKLQAEAAQLSAQMEQLTADIKARSDAYETASNQLNADISAFNQRATNGQFSSGGEFSAQRAALVGRVNRLAAERAAINDMIAQYNELVKQSNAIATQTDQLNQSINSNLAPAPSL